MSGVAVGPGGLVSVGWIIQGFHGVMWHSVDGSTWTADPPLGEDTQLVSVAADSRRYVAVGYEGAAAAVWTSTDGMAWQKAGPRSAFAAGPLRIMSVVHWAGGFAAAGYAGTNVGSAVPAFWVSSDGLTWQRAAVPSGMRGRVWSLAPAGSGLVAVGSIGPQEAPEAGAVWASPDGLRWTEQPSSATFGNSLIRSVANVPGVGLVAAGADAGGNNGEIWMSADGRRWTLSAGADAFAGPGADVRINALGAGGSGAVAVGYATHGSDSQYAYAAVWTSADGVSWRRSPDAIEFIAAELFGIVPWHGRLLAVGYSLAPDDDAATAWLSPASGLGN